MSAPKPGQKFEKAGSSPLRVSLGEHLAEHQAKVNAKAEAAAAKAELETAKTSIAPSSNPPPPEAVVIPRPPATPSTQDLIAASKEPAPAAADDKPARQFDSQILTGDMPIVVEEPQSAANPTAPSVTGPLQPPKPKTFFGHSPLPSAPPDPPSNRRNMDVQMLTGSAFLPERRFRKAARDSWAWLTSNKLRAFAFLVFGIILSGAVAAFVGLVVLPWMARDRGMTANEMAVPTAPSVPEVTAPVVVAEPEMLVVPDPPETEVEPGMRGRRRVLAREAFPRSCATAWDRPQPEGARYVCLAGQRHGSDLCDCYVFGPDR